MKTLFTGIYSLFVAEPANAFYTAIGGRLYLGEAPQGATYPYCVYSMPSNVPEYYFSGERLEEFLIQFSIFDKDGSASDIGTLFENLKTLFDDCTVTVAGYTCLIFERSLARLIRHPADNVWQHTVQYEVTLEKN